MIALAIAIAGAAANMVPYYVDPNCIFDVQDACNKCPWDISWVQFVTDGCDCNKFYQCYKIDGVITYTEFHCDPCMCFSNKLWTCSIKISDDPSCPTNPPPTIVPIPTIDVYTNCFCVNFDGDAREHQKYETESSCAILPTGTTGLIDGYRSQIKLLQSNGDPCHVEIPYFQNNQFRTFSLCGMFFYTGTGIQGLVNNGWNDDCAPGSIQMYIDANGFVVGRIRTEANQWFTRPSKVSAAPNKWYKTCMIFNGKGDQRTLTVTLDDGINGKQVATLTKKGLAGLTALEHCNLRLGEYLDINRTIYGFTGLLDSWCFSENLLRTTQCEEGSYGKQGPIQVE